MVKPPKHRVWASSCCHVGVHTRHRQQDTWRSPWGALGYVLFAPMPHMVTIFGERMSECGRARTLWPLAALPTLGTPAGAAFNQSRQMGQSVYSESVRWYFIGKECGLPGFQSLLQYTHATLNRFINLAECIFSALNGHNNNVELFGLMEK